ncbi:MAG: sugar phosphate isomerase/epimerase [Sphaerochaetaceae bacterium]|nr:sugar phosphate isomerase/epimerase [Sphaerochaetaceae bacterium]
MAEKATIRFATSPSSWGVLEKNGGPSGTTWMDFLDEASMAGYTNIELGPFGYFPIDRDLLERVLDNRDMRICAGTLCIDFERVRNFSYLDDDIDAMCDFLYDTGAKKLVLTDTSYRKADRPVTGKNLRRVFRMIRDIEEYAREVYELEAVFRPSVGSNIETEDEINLLLDSCPKINLCLDTGHFAFMNSHSTNRDDSTADFMSNHADRITYLHLSNVDPDILRHVRKMKMTYSEAMVNGVMCPLDRGLIDFRDIRDVLEKIAYDGTAVIDTLITNAYPGEAFNTARHNLDYLRLLGF